MATKPNINKTTDNNSNVDFSKAREVIGALLALFKVPSIPAPPINKRQALSATLRPGLSPTKIAANIIKRQSEAGAIIGANDDGSANISEKMELIRVEEIIKAIVSDARVTVVNLPGQTVKSEGGNAGGPIVTIGTTLTTSTAYGVMT